MRWFASLLALAVCLVCLPVWAAEKFVPLFDGKSLEGWEGDPELWRVQDGVIVGSTNAEKPLKANSFLATKKSYANFVLKAKFKLKNHNSGIQFRSDLLENYRVVGYQADIADNQYMGILYEEGKRSAILANVKADEVAKHVKKDEWNEYVIRADKSHITLAINGFTTVDYTEESDKGATSGIIALQLHVGPPMQVEFKDIEIAELP